MQNATQNSRVTCFGTSRLKVLDQKLHGKLRDKCSIVYDIKELVYIRYSNCLKEI